MKPDHLCDYLPYNNGAFPDWSRGNSQIIRVGSRVFVSHNRVDPDCKPLNNTFLELWEKRDGGAWRLVWTDEEVYQREPCPLVYLGNGQLVVSVNMPEQPRPKGYAAMDERCVPSLYVFDISGEVTRTAVIPLPWDRDENLFWEHSYRSLARDDRNGSILQTNIEYSGDYRFCYALMNSDLTCRKTGYLQFPQRCCYHTIAARNDEVYLFATQDIKETVDAWREYKRQITGVSWDYDFRKIYMNYCPDIGQEDFQPSQLICDRSATCGWTTNHDCCYDANDDMLLLVSAQRIKHPFMRERFFPDQPLESTLELYRFRHGKLIDKILVDRSVETEENTIYSGFFHTAANGDVYLLWSKQTHQADSRIPTGMYLSRVDALAQEPLRLHSQYGNLFGSKCRLGAAPSDVIDLYWTQNSSQIFSAAYQLNR